MDYKNLIDIKDNLYCLNDIAEKIIKSKNVKEYIHKIPNKTIISGNYYIPKNIVFDILNKSKSPNATDYLNYINNGEKIYIENNILNRKYVDFGRNEIIYENKRILFFEHNNIIYFDGKDICDILEHSNVNDALTNYVEESDNFTFEKGNWIEDKTLSNKNEKIIQTKYILEKKLNKVIESTDIFVNEVGLYSLISSSNSSNAKEFKKWITHHAFDIIRKTINYDKISNEYFYDENKLRELESKPCLYVIYVGQFLYKFGISRHSQKRMNAHKNNLNYNKIIRIYQLPNLDITVNTENRIKKYTINSKIRKYLDEGNEFFETNQNYPLEKILNEISKIIDDETIKYNNDVFDFNKKCDRILEIERERTEQLRLEVKKLELELKVKEVNIQNPKNIKEEEINIDDIIIENINEQDDNDNVVIPIGKKKCKDCDTLVNKRNERCSICVYKFKHKNAVEKTFRPSLIQLELDLKILGSYVKVAQKYNVTDNTIRKWIRKYKKNNT